jgi:uncharacterized coiled-coil protein SlyX
MGSFLKTLAIAAGAGVAFGLCTSLQPKENGSRRASRGESVPRPAGPDAAPASGVFDGSIDISPLLDRLEAIERRFEATAAVAAPPAPAVSELTRRIDAQDAEIGRLREMVDVRANEIQGRLEAEMDERHRRALETIEKTVEFKISERIAALERALGEQSASIDALRTRAQETDSNLQRLIVAIERLCERTQVLQTPAPVPVPVPAPGPVVVPFSAHLEEVIETEVDPAAVFRSDVFREVEPAEPKKARFALTRIFGTIALMTIMTVAAQVLS